MSDNKTSPTPQSSGSTSDLEKAEALIQIVLAIPNATIHHLASATSEKKLTGRGELRVYSSTLPNSPGSIVEKVNKAPPTTFMTLETDSTPSKSLITHPLMPSSTAQKTGDRTWRFSVPGQGYLELDLPQASAADIASLENLLTDRIIYTNQYSLRNQLALVDDVGQIYGVLDTDEAEVDDDDNVSLSENAKSPVVVEAIEPKDGDDDTPLKLKVSVPSADDMSDYLTSASQYFGESLVKGATIVAGGITTSSTYLNSKIPETQKPLKISPFIKNRIRNVAKVSRVTFGLTGRVKSAIINKVLSSGFKALKYWTSKDDPESYSTMQNVAYSILISAGVLIQAAEESISIVTGPAITATTDLAGRALGPDVKELVAEAMESFRNFTLVYFDRSGVSRRAFLQTSRVAALQTAQEIKEGKLKMRERKKNPSEHIQPLAASAGAAATQVKELIFSYFEKAKEHLSGKANESSSSLSSSDEEGSSSKKTTGAATDVSSSKGKKKTE
ncbi:hypothetical protein BGZ51_006281 [Haplosporangium sp. Z 767]|nr:hypothetical protein BGZ50_006398 [Haplosporangium sp. Z 11]KAF9180339.1 hypothetical protein BGZ51_006281 [Haplosporangium sp. Z 767]